MRQLKPEYQQLADDYNQEFGDRGCTCHVCPPCGSCIHPGNPLNLAEDEGAWLKVTQVSNRRAKHLRKRGKRVSWSNTAYSWLYHREAPNV